MKFVVKDTQPEDPDTPVETYFVLVADNGEPVFTSETYTEPSSAMNTIEAIKRGAATATVERVRS